MRISQLAAATGVPVATVKYYLREKLLHEGELTSATQARYDESHVRRLRLVRALLGPGGLTVAAARQLLHDVDAPPDPPLALLGMAHHAVRRPVAGDVDLTRAAALVRGWGWRIEEQDTAALEALADALHGLEAADFQLPEGALDHYAEVMGEVATTEIAAVPTDSNEAAVRYVVLGTVLVEPLLLALRRLAQQDASVRRFAAGDLHPPVTVPGEPDPGEEPRPGRP